MAPAYVICKGEADAAVLTELLRSQSLSAGTKVIATDSRSSALGRARTRAAVGPAAAVALALDSDILDPVRAAGDRQDLQDLLRMASGGRPCETFLFLPPLDAIFFDAPDLLARALHVESIPDVTLVAARYVPKQELTALLEKAGQAYDAKSVRKLVRSIGADRLAQHPTVRPLLAFLSRVAPRAKQASVA